MFGAIFSFFFGGGGGFGGIEEEIDEEELIAELEEQALRINYMNAMDMVQFYFDVDQQGAWRTRMYVMDIDESGWELGQSTRTWYSGLESGDYEITLQDPDDFEDEIEQWADDFNSMLTSYTQ